MKKYTVFIVALCLVGLVFVPAYAGDYTRHNALEIRQTEGDYQGGRNALQVKDKNGNVVYTINFDGDIPVVNNLVENKKLAFWSGATCSSASASAAPDRWTLYDSTNTGLTRLAVSGVSMIPTGATPYGNLGYAMYIEEQDSIYSNVDEIAYQAGVSNQSWWIDKFSGTTVQAGFMVYTDPGTTGATDFIRTYIVTCTNSRTPGVTGFATYSTDYDGGGWDFLSASTIVPNDATAFEVGLELNATALSGPSAFVMGPVIISGSTVGVVPNPTTDEILFFDQHVAFNTNGPGFDLVAGTSSFNVENLTDGKIPPDVDSLYVIYQGQHAAAGNHISFRPDTATTSGGTIYAIGTGLETYQGWVKCDAAGDFDLYTSSTVNGVSVFVTGGKTK